MFEPKDLEKPTHETRKFQTPEEEIAFLRNKLKEKINQHAKSGETSTQEQVADSLVTAYKKVPKEQSPGPTMQEAEIHKVATGLDPEVHDPEVSKLYQLILHKGIKNTLDIVENMGKPHLTDDFHRFLVQFLVSKGSTLKSSMKESLQRHLEQALFQIELPPKQKDQSQGPSYYTNLMHQLMQGLDAMLDSNPKSTIAFEMAIPEESDYLYFYIAIPRTSSNYLEKLVKGLFSEAIFKEVTNDYNIFYTQGASKGAYGTLKEPFILPIATYKDFENDPMEALISAFSKFESKGEGASFQIVLSKQDEVATTRNKKALELLMKGESLKKAMKKSDQSLGKSMMRAASSLLSSSDDDKDDLDPSKTAHYQETVKSKLDAKIHPVTLRILTSAKEHNRAQEMLDDITSTFAIYDKAHGNELDWKQVSDKKMRTFSKDFIFRSFDAINSILLNNQEIATIFHFPASHEHSAFVKQSRSKTNPPPFGMDPDGIRLGINSHRGEETIITLDEKARMRHLYVIGQTGVGKSGSLLNMIAQDIKNGEGCCFIDPHGSDVQTILSFIPPERYEDVIYFDPAHIDRPMGLNMLEFDHSRPDQKTLIIDELLGIFNQLFDMKVGGGAMFQQYFKNSALLVMEDPESGCTLLEITRVLSDKAYRDQKLAKTKNPIIKQFWTSAEQTKGEQSLANFVPYISSKFDPLISNEILRPVIVQQQSAFNMREIMDNKKILLVNLSKGRLGELNANLIGLILVGKIQMAALGRADSHGKDYPPFYLYIDEFQNVTTPSIASILSEARKYKLSLNVAHQYMGQLNDQIKGAVLGNVGNMCVFRISPEDAYELEKRYEPYVSAQDMIGQDNREAYLSILVNGEPAPAFNIRTENFPDMNNKQVEKLKELSFMKYGKPRDQVEAEIMSRYDQSV